VELRKNPPDVSAAQGKVDDAKDDIQAAYDDGDSNLGQYSKDMGLLTAIILEVGEDEDAPFSVEIGWDPSVDEGSGEQDIVRYLIYRSGSSSGPWGNPIVSIPAGATSYLFEDETVEPDSTYWYAYAAQDCTPSLSPLSTPLQVTIQ
jgi:hypothetical protein